jgi:hypothetical protein
MLTPWIQVEEIVGISDGAGCGSVHVQQTFIGSMLICPIVKWGKTML